MNTQTRIGRERVRERVNLSVGFRVGRRGRGRGASFRTQSSAPVIDGFGSDRANGSLRRGEAPLGGRRATEFDGGVEHREAAASDYNGHLKLTVSLPEFQFQLFLILCFAKLD
jgi:hypothetical protein